MLRVYKDIDFPGILLMNSFKINNEKSHGYPANNNSNHRMKKAIKFQLEPFM